ncbi:testis-specific serine/threonine-protein kinase 1-like [Saccostrea echinata]|uniref:testis-specific serine/threonine-protein kinase 1-like n=1 Tax=Saccostrea echinata TaxID=191078 RepID=UPI002A83ED7F|nr:testis-specific serine/threonine-protein kinase 1-like [Saccostrea echinata]
MDAYEAKIIKLEDKTTLNTKGELWKPNKNSQASLEHEGYEFKGTITSSQFSKIKTAHFKKENIDVAVKIIKKYKLPKDVLEKFIPREIAILQRVQHHGIVDLLAVYESPCCFYLVMELLPRGDLLEFVSNVGYLTEPDARRFFHQLLDIVAYLHKENICHRDIKLENLMLDCCFNLKLTDFGIARYINNSEKLSTTCGSYVYTAPEVMNGEEYNGAQADIWSMGVCLYAMLCGKLPFRDDDVDILRQSMRERLHFHRHVSKACRYLLRKMLSYEPENRPPIQDIRRTDWMCKPIKNVGESSVSSLSVAAVTSDLHPNVTIDPNAEHGFSCNQKDKRFKSTKVSDILHCVTENHSTGTSKVDLKAIPALKPASVAAITGVAGPIGRKISQQMGLNIDTSTEKKDPPVKSGLGKAGFSRAMKGLRTFKRATTVIRATRRFKRGPLNTILKISQEEAMAKIMDQNHKQVEHETKELHRCTSGKLATHLKAVMHEENLSKKKSQLEMEQAKQEHDEKTSRLRQTVLHLMPNFKNKL